MALLSGVLFRHDAISHSLRLKLELLRRLRVAGRPLDVTAFVQATDEPAADVVVCHDVADLGYRPGFLDADLYVFEFGIHYQLFDAVFLIPDRERVLAVYHNITPLELITDAAVRPTIERSYVQRSNLTRAGHIACVSDFNRRDLLEAGFEATRLSTLHLPPGHEPRPRAIPAPSDPVELLFIGRLVQAKGILDLLEACKRLASSSPAPFHVSIVGSSSFSEESVLRELEDASGSVIRYLGALSDDDLAEALGRSDVLVMPSYHEGYCLPVVEAFQAGCRVIAYDAGNLPSIVDGHGHVVATGDVDALTEAIEIAITEVAGERRGAPPFVTTSYGRIEERMWRARVAAHVARHGQRAYELQLLRLLADRERAVPASQEARSRT